jgi:integrase
MATGKFVLYKPYKDRKSHTANGNTPDDTNHSKKTNKAERPLNPLETRLYFYLIIDRDHIIKVKTEHVIYPKQWDFKKQLKKEIPGNLAGTPEENEKIKKFNKDLLKLKDDIETKYKDTVKENPNMPFKQVAKIVTNFAKYKEIPFNNNDKGFFAVLDDYIKFLEGEVAPGTIKKYTTLKNSLTKFIESNKKYESLSFSMIDASFKDAFIGYLRKVKPLRGRQMSRPEELQAGLYNNTIGKYIETLKTFCTWAEERGFNKFTAYKDFRNFSKADKKRMSKKHDIVTLTMPELSHFYYFDLSKNPHLDRVRDLWCFSAYTVQRWSDIQRFDKSQLEDDVWSFEAFKTKKKTEIDLVGYFAPALDILKKYNYDLPKISNQKFNKYLKEAVKLAGINSETKRTRYIGSKEILITKPKSEFLSSHDARRTGISILLNEFNFPISHLMEITQHSNISTLQVYINKDRQARREAVCRTKRIDELLTVTHKAG